MPGRPRQFVVIMLDAPGGGAQGASDLPERQAPELAFWSSGLCPGIEEAGPVPLF